MGIWRICEPILKTGRPGDDKHAAASVRFILEYRGALKFDRDVLIPVAMMHDIGHSAILPKHMKLVTGVVKLPNAKLVHMLAGAKIAEDLLRQTKYPKKIREEIVEIISTHDYDQMEGVDITTAYDTENKRVWHDIDSLDRFDPKRIGKILGVGGKTLAGRKIAAGLKKLLESFFYD